jgi:hypothetical protein
MSAHRPLAAARELPHVCPGQRCSIEESHYAGTSLRRGLSAVELAEFWASIVSSHIDNWKDRRQHQAEEAAAKAAGDFALAREFHSAWYDATIGLAMTEALIGLLHRILAPSADCLCGIECEHVAAGATRQQCERFLASVEAEMGLYARRAAECGGTWLKSTGHWDNPEREAYEFGLEDLEVWREAFAELFEVEGSEAATAEASELGPARRAYLNQRELLPEIAAPNDWDDEYGLDIPEPQPVSKPPPAPPTPQPRSHAWAWAAFFVGVFVAPVFLNRLMPAPWGIVVFFGAVMVLTIKEKLSGSSLPL